MCDLFFMTEIGFYLLDKPSESGLDATLPKVVQTVIKRGLKIVLRCENQERLEKLDQLFWSYEPTSFLAHVKEGEEGADKANLYLTTSEENPLDADVLITLSGLENNDFSQFSRVLDMFEHTDAQKDAARKRWKEFKDKGYPLKYFAFESNKWVQKM